VGGWVGR